MRSAASDGGVGMQEALVGSHRSFGPYFLPPRRLHGRLPSRRDERIAGRRDRFRCSGPNLLPSGPFISEARPE